MDKRIKKDPVKKAPVEVPYRKIPEIQQTEYVFEGENRLENKQEIAKNPEKYYGGPTKTDVLGSYTGQPTDRYEQPVQDADDL